MCGRKPPLFALSLVILLASSSVVQAQLPATRLSALFPPGAQAGQTVEVTIAGDDLDDVAALNFSHPGISAKQAMLEPGPFDKGPQPAPNQFVVTTAANVPPGVYEARAVGKYGTSNPRSFTVGDLAEMVETEPNNNGQQATEIALPAVINGQSNVAGDVDYYKFTAAAGQRLVVAGYARRIDSPLDMIVTLYDARGRQLGGSRDGLQGDSLIAFRTPAAGEYLLKVHDAGYQGSAEHYYRLRVGALPVIDFVFPPAGVAGGNRPFTLYGVNLPGGQPAGLVVDGRALEKLAVNIPLPAGAGAQALNFNSLLDPAAAGIDGVEYRIKGAAGLSNAALIGIATGPPVNEAEPNNAPSQAQTLTAPCEVMGQFYGDRDRDWYQINARQGESFTAEVISQRMGVRSHPSLLVERVVKPAEGETPEQTQTLGFVSESNLLDGGPEFDIRHRDPSFHFTAPADGLYRIMVRDAFGDVKSDPRRVYRLALNNGQPDFRLAAVPEGSHSALLLRKGGQAAIRVVSFRRDGFAGEIEVSATGLPAGVTATTGVIGPEANHTMIVLSAAANAGPATGMVQVIGKATLGSTAATRVARCGSALIKTTVRQNPSQLSPVVSGRINNSLAVSISAGEQAPVTNFKAGDGKVIELPRGGKVKIPISRAGDFKGKLSYLPRGLPANITAPAGAIDANKTTAELPIDLRGNTPVGTYTFYLDGVAEQIDYARNPEAAAAAAERKKEVDAIKVMADAEAKAATEAKAAADKQAAEAATAVQQATQAKEVAEQALTVAMTAAKTAAEQAAQAKSAAEANAGDAGLATAAANALKAVTEAEAKEKTAMATVATAQKTLDTAVAAAKAADEAKAAADLVATEKGDLAKLATELKTKTDKLATDTSTAAKVQKRFDSIISTPITLKITPAPVTLAEVKIAAPIKQGGMAEAPVSITRLYGYTDPVNIGVTMPPGVTGISIPAITIAANQSAGKFMIVTAGATAVGEYELTMRATMTLNGQGITVEQPLRLVIAKADPPK